MKLFEILDLDIQHLVYQYINENNRFDFLLKSFNTQLQSIKHDSQATSLSPEQILTKLADIDPTNNKQYLQFLTKIYIDRQFRLEDANRIRNSIQLFNSIKPKLPIDQRNILNIKHLRQLYSIIKPFENQDVISTKQQKRQNKDEGVTKIIDTPNFKVLHIQTEAAAKLYGKGTQWCTSGDIDNQFEYYNKKGKIYVIIAGDRKFQIHMEENQFMDEEDIDILETREAGERDDIEFLSQFPEYTKFLNMLIKEYYGA